MTHPPPDTLSDVVRVATLSRMQMGMPVTVRGHGGETIAYLLDVTADGCTVRSADRLLPGARVTVDVIVDHRRLPTTGVVDRLVEPHLPAPVAVVVWTGAVGDLAAALPSEPPDRRWLPRRGRRLPAEVVDAGERRQHPAMTPRSSATSRGTAA